MSQNTEIKVGKTYRLGTYASYGACDLVRVTEIKHDHRAWYDDHQGGGWMSRGGLFFEYVDAKTAIKKSCGEPCYESIEYAQDHWEPAN